MDEMSLRRRVELLEEEIRDLNRRMQLLEPKAEVAPEPAAAMAEMPVAEETLSAAPVVHPPPLPQATEPAAHNTMKERFQAAKIEAEAEMHEETESAPAWEPAMAEQKHTLMPETGNAELLMGQVWAVRIGVLLLFTGFVFLANYAWEHYISQLGAMPRLILLTLLATGGVVAGEIMRRKPRLGTFGEVIAAGGLAALYYCAFASHHIDRLRVIDSPSLGAILLTITGLGILGYGAWRRASVMCAIALLLSFYGTSIQPVVLTAMISGLIVAAAGAWLCLQFQWKSLGVVGLIGAYVAFTLWQGLLYEAPAFSLGTWFLCSYWLLYHAVILHKKNPWDSLGTMVICTLNYGLLAAYLPFDWSLFEWDDRCWMVYGVLAVISLTIWRWLEGSRGRHLLSETFLMQGIGLLTLAIVTKWSGHELFLILAVKGLVLLGWDRFNRRNNIEVSGWMLLLLSSAFALFAGQEALASWIWSVYAVLLLTGVCVARRVSPEPEALRDVCRWVVSAISLITLITGVLSPMVEFRGALVMIALSLVFTAANRFLRGRFPAPEFTALALGAAILAEIVLCMSGHRTQEWVLVTGLCLAFGHAVVHPQSIEHWKTPKISEHQGILLTIAAWLLMGCYFAWHMPFDTWTPVVAVAIMASLHALAKLLKWDILRGTAPLFSLAVLILTGPQLLSQSWQLYLTFAMLSGYAAWLTLCSEEKPMAAAPLLCGAMGLSWLLVQESHSSIYLLLLPLALCLSPLRHTQLWRGAMVLWAALSFFCFLDEQNDKWLTYVVPALWYGALAFRARVKGGVSVPWTKSIAVLVTVSMAAKATAWVDGSDGAHQLTILWALLAVFCFSIGFLIREALMRLMMLLLLLASMGNILASVWQLGTLMRIASFLVTGLIFLLLGYIYNKHPEWFGKSEEKSPTAAAEEDPV